MTIPYITPTQQEIAKLIYQFRFLNSKQIQKLLNHKDKSKINKWLKDLTVKQYLEKLEKENSFEQRTKPNIYIIGINGIRFLKTQDNCLEEIIRKLYKDKDRSDSFISYCQFLADIYLDLKTQNKDGVTYEVIMSSDFVNTDSRFNFLTDLNPNLVYKAEKHKKGTKNRYYLLEVFEATLPRYSIKKRIRTYLEFYFSNEWENNIHKPFPILKFICPTKADLIYAKRITQKLLEENQNPNDLSIQFITIDEVKKSGAIDAIWEEVD